MQWTLDSASQLTAVLTSWNADPQGSIILFQKNDNKTANLITAQIKSHVIHPFDFTSISAYLKNFK